MSKKKILKPLTFTLIEEGRLQKSLEEALAEAGGKLLAHVNKYGAKSTAKSKAKVSLELTLSPSPKSMDEEEDTFLTYEIESKIRTTLPGRPHVATTAIASTDQLGEETLFVRGSGSSPGEDPAQLKLATDDGRAIDPETHEAIDPSKSKKEPKAPKEKS